MLSLDPAVIDQSSPIPAERRLWAVLCLAVCDLLGIDKQRHPIQSPRLRHFAELWFRSERDTPGSFRWVCDELELDAGWLRRRVLEMAGKNAHVSTREMKAVDPGLAEVALTVPDTYQQLVGEMPEESIFQWDIGGSTSGR